MKENAIKIKKSIRNHGSGGMYTHTHTQKGKDLNSPEPQIIINNKNYKKKKYF